MTTLTSQQERAYAEGSIRYVVERSFVDFLRYVRIESDEGLGQIGWVPWPSLVERAEAWGRGESEVVLKARQLGMSWLVAAYSLWVAGFHESNHVGSFSVGQRESRQQLRRCRYIWRNLPEFLRPAGTFKVDEAEFENGSMIIALPSTEDAGISYTFRLIVADELAFHPYGAQNYAAYRPTISAGGQFIGLSTADPSLGPAGFFYDLYWDTKAGKTPYSAVFLPWNARPGRDAAWKQNELEAYASAPDGTVEAYFPETDADAFIARSGLVYPMFSRERHLRADPCRWEDYKYRVAGVDFGGGDPTAVIPLGVTAREHVHQPEEFYERGPVGVDQIAAYLSALHRRAPFWAILCDPSEPAAIQTLRNLGLPAFPADNRRAEGFGAVRFLLDNDRFSMNPATCSESLKEFFTYRWAERTDPSSRQRYATSTPVDHHADGHDARRYAMLALMQAMQRRQAQEVKLQFA